MTTVNQLGQAKQSGRVCYINHTSADGMMEDVLEQGQKLRYIHVWSVTGEHTRTTNPAWSPEVEEAWIAGWNEARADSREMPLDGYWTS